MSRATVGSAQFFVLVRPSLERKQKRVRFTLPYKGSQAGEVEVLPERDAALLVSQGWAEED